MQSSWGASHNGSMDHQQAAAWPDHFDFGDPDSHFDVSQWTDAGAGDGSFNAFDPQGHQALFQAPDQQSHLQQPSYAAGHDPAIGSHNMPSSTGFDAYDASKFAAFDQDHGQGQAHHGSTGYANGLADFVRHDGQYGQALPEQYPVPPQPQHSGPVYGGDTNGGHMPPSQQQQQQQPQVSLGPQQASQASQSMPPLASGVEAHSFGGALPGQVQSAPVKVQPAKGRQTKATRQAQAKAQSQQHAPLVQQPILPTPQPAQQHVQYQGHAQPLQPPQSQPIQHSQTSAVPAQAAQAVENGSMLGPGFQPSIHPQLSASSAQAASLAAPAKTASPRPSAEALGEPASKRRKKAAPVLKKAVTAVASIESTPELADSPATFTILPPRLPDDIDSLPAPEPSAEDKEVIALAKKRKVPKFTTVGGLPHLAATSTVKLPAPKSHDKLLPIVAHPSRSGKPVVPELGADLPCEVQGRFSAAYRPDPSVPGGLDQRRTEAAPLLAKFEQDMASLGRRRPRYTEYPQSFKDQIKSDEAVKTKAERKAKKEKEDAQPSRSDVRPDDPVEAAGWDILGAVTFESAAQRTTKAIGEAVLQVRDILTALRSKLTQAKQEYDQKVKDGKDSKEIATAKKQYDVRHEALYKALDVTIMHGEDAVLENLGGHPRLVLTLVNILISCINSGEVNGKIAKATLELMTHFSMTEKVSHQANFTSVQKRLADKGDAETRDLLKDVVAAIKDTGDSKDKDAPPPSPTARQGQKPAAKPAATSATAAASSSSSKRARVEDEAEPPRTVKKVAVDSGNSLSRKMGPQKFNLSSASKTPAKSGSVTTYSSKARPISKPAPKIETPIPEGNELVRLVNARPDPSRMMTRLEAAKSQATSSRSTTAAPSAASTPASGSSGGGIASLLDMINAPAKERPAPRVFKALEAPETAAEKSKRLRKEARRRLRVTWRPDDELEQVRVFHQDAHELEGRSANLTRDAADGRREGMLLKQRKNQSLDDDEDEDDSDAEISARPWTAPMLAAWAPLPEKARANNYTTRGGDVTFETYEQKVMAEREQRMLMAIYTDAADIPPTPKSPALEPAPYLDHDKVVPLPPSFAEIHRRWETAAKFGQMSALYYATQRLEAAKPAAKPGQAVGSSAASVKDTPRQAPKAPGAPVVLPAGSVEDQVVYLLSSDRIKAWTDNEPFANVKAKPADSEALNGVIAEIAALVKILSGKPYPPTQPPDWLADFNKVQEWWTGFHQDVQKAKGPEEVPRPVPPPALFPSPFQQPAWASFLPPPPLQHPQQQPAMPPYAQALPQQQQQPPPLASYLSMLQPGQGYHPPSVSEQQPPTYAPLHHPPPPPPRSGSDLAAIFAQLSQANSVPQRPQLPPPPGYIQLNPNDNSLAQLAMLQQLAQQSSGGPQSARVTEETSMDWEPDRRDRDRDHGGRERSWGNNNNNNNSNNDREWDSRDGWNDQKRGGTTKKVTLPPHRPVNAALIGTKPCTFWRQGKCARGDSCTFRHD